MQPTKREKTIYMLIQSFFILWIMFIPIKTLFYQIAWVGIIFSFLLLCFTVQECVKEFTSLLIRLKDVLVLFGCISFAITLASLLNPDHRDVHWRWELSYIFQYMVIFFIMLYSYEKKILTLRLLVKTIFIVLFIYAIDGLWQLVTHQDFLRHKIGSIKSGLCGPTYSRNVYGMLTAITAFISFATAIEWYTKMKKSERIFLWVLFVIALVDMLLSYSRASWLFFLTASSVFVFFSLKRGTLNKKYLIIALLIVCSLAVILLIMNPHLQHRFMQLLQGYSSHRLQMWPLAIQKIKEHWLFGHGFVDSLYYLKSVEHARAIHNSFLEILFTVGVFGFIFYTLLLIVVLKQILRNDDPVQMGFFWGFLVLTQFDQSMIKGSVQLSILTLFAFFVFKERLLYGVQLARE